MLKREDESASGDEEAHGANKHSEASYIPPPKLDGFKPSNLTNSFPGCSDVAATAT